jgi:hypothetical protein
MIRFPKPVLGLLFSFPGSAVAQSAISVVIAGQVHGTKARFADERPTSDQISLVTRPYRNWVLGAALDLSPRHALQATVGLTSYGLAFERQPSGNVATFWQNALEFAVVLRREYRVASKPGRWFTDAGADLVYIGDTFGISSFGFGGANPNNVTGPGSESTGVPIGGSPYRMGLRAGAGREWALSPRHFVALQALASVGLHDLQRYDMRTVVWQQGRTIDPVYYRNTIATRFSFVGVQARYRFHW